ncbi:hypothetical protein FRB96_002169 [Tulasnella sp. 330]|nr:hypothetical protein FRB96_002169 [Tulasnella sp. 330]
MLCDLKISETSFTYGDGLERYLRLSKDTYNPSVSYFDDGVGSIGEDVGGMWNEPLAVQTPHTDSTSWVNNLGGKAFHIPNEKLYPLRHFRIVGRSTLWEPKALSRLESLELRNPGHVRRIKITEIITILRSSEGLVILTLDQLQLDDLDVIAHDTAPVELSRLTDLTLSSLPLHGLHELLTRIRVPICRRLIVDCTDRPYATILDSQTAHLGPPIQAILSATRNARLHITPDKVQLFATLDDSPWSVFVYLHLPSSRSSGPMDWLNHTLSSMIRPPTIGLIIEAQISSKLIPPPLDILPYVDLLHIVNSKKEAIA